MRPRAAALALVLAGLALPRPVRAAEDPLDALYAVNGLALRADARLFALYAALNAMGYDEAPLARELPFAARRFSPIRQRVRAAFHLSPRAVRSPGRALRVRPASDRRLRPLRPLARRRSPRPRRHERHCRGLWPCPCRAAIDPARPLAPRRFARALQSRCLVLRLRSEQSPSRPIKFIPRHIHRLKYVQGTVGVRIHQGFCPLKFSAEFTCCRAVASCHQQESYQEWE